MTASAGPPLTDPLAAVAAAESVLSATAAAGLPDTAPGAPWVCTASGVAWVHRASGGARGALSDLVGGRASLPLTTGLFLRYTDTPVGPYSEVLGVPRALPGVLPGASVPFIAVDSPASIRGGRAEWALPKVAAAFTWFGNPGDPAFTVRAAGTTPEGEAWSVTAAVRTVARLPTLPLGLVFRLVQPDPAFGLRSATAAMAATARVARVEVETTGPALPGWLTPGEHLGVVLPRLRVRIGKGT